MTTPGQTVGPFFHLGLTIPGGNDLVPPGRPGAIRLHGFVLDGDGAPVPDALIEVGQTGPDGAVARASGSLHRDGWTFTGWGRSATDTDGHYSFTTLEPGGPPFFALTVFARGLTDRLFTRAYRPDAEADPWLGALPSERRGTLVTTRDEHGLRFDIRLQGEGETVFLTFPEHGGR